MSMHSTTAGAGASAQEPFTAHRATRRHPPFVLRVAGHIIEGDGSPESIAGCFDRFPADLQRHMLLRGACAQMWEAAVTDMLFDTPSGANGRVWLDYVETEADGYLYHYPASGPRFADDRFCVWDAYILLTVVFDGQEYGRALPLPGVKMAGDLIGQALPPAAQAWWEEHGGTPLTFYALVFELQARPPLHVRDHRVIMHIEFKADGEIGVSAGVPCTANQLIECAAGFATRKR